MKPNNRKRSVGGFAGLLVLIIMAASSCTSELSIQVLQPAEVDTTGIKNVAIGSFELVEVNRTSQIERNGKWKSHRSILTKAQKKALSNQIRARVINLLSATPYFQLNYTDEFQKLETDRAMQQAIAAGGFRTTAIDAVISGKVWLDVVHSDGVEVGTVELEFIQGGRKGTFNYFVETIVFWPYKSVRGTMGLEMKLTRLNPNEVISVNFDKRQASYRIGGKPRAQGNQLFTRLQLAGSAFSDFQSEKNTGQEFENSDLVLPNFEQLVADLAESIAAQFVRRVSVTQKSVSYPIATGGNDTGRMLIEAGAYEMAIQTLTRELNQSDEKDPDDLYNLGLCYEATGDFGLAEVTYNDAIAIEPENFTYAQGLGRIERMKRENRRLKSQLSSK